MQDIYDWSIEMKFENQTKYLIHHQHEFETRPSDNELNYLMTKNPKAYHHVEVLLNRCLKAEVTRIRSMKRIKRILRENP